MKKRLLSFILALCLVFAQVPFPALAAEQDGSGGSTLETTAPTEEETTAPTEEETTAPTEEETTAPTEEATTAPTEEETTAPTEGETTAPTEEETTAPTEEETTAPTEEETTAPTEEETTAPTEEETTAPTEEATTAPTEEETTAPTEEETTAPTEETISLCAHGRETGGCSVCAVEAQIEALPTAEAAAEMRGEAYNAAYAQAEAVSVAFSALDEEDQLLVANYGKLKELFGLFNQGIMELDLGDPSNISSLTVGGVSVTDEAGFVQAESGEGWTFDAGTNTLTLDQYYGGDISFDGGDLTICVAEYSYMGGSSVWANGGSLTITGGTFIIGGTLTGAADVPVAVENGDVRIADSIHVDTLSVNGSQLNASSGMNANSITAVNSDLGADSISCDSLNVTGGELSYSTLSGAGNYHDCLVTEMRGSDLVITVHGNVKRDSYYVRTGDTLIIPEGSSLTVNDYINNSGTIQNHGTLEAWGVTGNEVDGKPPETLEAPCYVTITRGGEAVTEASVVAGEEITLSASAFWKDGTQAGNATYEWDFGAGPGQTVLGPDFSMPFSQAGTYTVTCNAYVTEDPEELGIVVSASVTVNVQGTVAAVSAPDAKPEYFATVQEALDYAAQMSEAMVRVLDKCDVTETLTVTHGNVILDLGGKILSMNGAGPLLNVEGGRISIYSGTLMNETGDVLHVAAGAYAEAAMAALVAPTGTAVVNDGEFLIANLENGGDNMSGGAVFLDNRGKAEIHGGMYRVTVGPILKNSGSLTVGAGIFLSRPGDENRILLASSGGNAQFSGGTFGVTEVTGTTWNAILAPRRGIVKMLGENDSVDYTLQDNTTNLGDGAYSIVIKCEHPSEQVTETGWCNACKSQAYVAENGGTMYATVLEALSQGGTTKLLCDVEFGNSNPIYVKGNTEATLDMADHILITQEDMAIGVADDASLTIQGAGAVDNVWVEGNATLVINGKINLLGQRNHFSGSSKTLIQNCEMEHLNLNVEGSAKVKISGGTFRVGLSANVPLAGLLADGKVYYVDGMQHDVTNKTDLYGVVKVDKVCEHEKDKYEVVEGICENCGARVYVAWREDEDGGTNRYGALDEAFGDAEFYQTLTLYCNVAEDMDLDDPNADFTFDLAGHTIDGSLTVTDGKIKLKNGTITGGITLDNGKTLADVLAPGYGIRDMNGQWISDLTATSCTYAEIAGAPITSGGNFTANGTTNLTVFYGEPITLDWKVDGDVEKYELSAQGETLPLEDLPCILPFNLLVGDYTMSCVASVNGYILESNEVTIHVKEAVASVKLGGTTTYYATFQAAMDYAAKHSNASSPATVALMPVGYYVGEDASVDAPATANVILDLGSDEFVVKSLNWNAPAGANLTVEEAGFGRLTISGGSSATLNGCYIADLRNGDTPYMKLSTTGTVTITGGFYLCQVVQDPSKTDHGLLSIQGGTIRSLLAGKGCNIEISGGVFGKIDLQDNLTISSIMAAGKGLQEQTGDWADLSQAKVESNDGYQAKLLPLTLTGDLPETKTVITKSSEALTFGVTPTDQTQTVTYVWTVDDVEKTETSNTFNLAELAKTKGTYKVTCAATCDGYTLTSRTCVLTVADAVAQVTTATGEITCYPTIQEAFDTANANEGSTLMLLSDVTADQVDMTSPIMLDLNGHNLNAKIGVKSLNSMIHNSGRPVNLKAVTVEAGGGVFLGTGFTIGELAKNGGHIAIAVGNALKDTTANEWYDVFFTGTIHNIASTSIPVEITSISGDQNVLVDEPYILEVETAPRVDEDDIVWYLVGDEEDEEYAVGPEWNNSWTKAGDYQVYCVVTKDGYSEKSETITIHVGPIDLSKCDVTLKKTTASYTGSPHEISLQSIEYKYDIQDIPMSITPKLTDGGYTVTAKDPAGNAVGLGQIVDAGIYEITVSAAPAGERFENSQTVTYTVSQKNIDITIDVDDENLVYDGKPKTPAVTVKYDEITLVKDRDYTLAYEDNTNADGQPKVKVSPVEGSNYTFQEKTEEFQIKPKNITGEVKIIGDPAVGETLTASYMGSETISYQWMANGGYVGTDSNTYVPTVADIGKKIQVKVWGTGNYGGYQDSNELGPVTYCHGVNLPDPQVGYELKPDKTSVNWGDTVTLTFTLKEGWNQTADFAVKADGTALMDNGNGTFTIPAERTQVHQAIQVTVEGVADLTPPTATLTMGQESWSGFGTAGEHFYNAEQKLAIEADDAGSGVGPVGYLLSDTVLDKTAVEAQTGWQTYTDPITVGPDANGQYIYVKVTDQAGNPAYFRTPKLMYDNEPPVITGIENGKTYCKEQAFEVSDDNLDSVTVNGEPLKTRASRTGTLPVGGTYEITALDQAGNRTAVKVTVNDGHTYAWEAEGGTITETCQFCDEHSATATVQAPAGAQSYNGNAHDASVRYTGTLSGGNGLTIAYTKDGQKAEDTVNAGTYTASITIGTASASVTYTVAPREVSLAWTAPENLTYDGTAKVPAVQAQNLVDGDTVNAEAERTQGGDNVNAGTFTFTAKSLDNGNYKLPVNAVSPAYTIIPAEIKGTVTITGPAVVGSELTAAYAGQETVSFQWRRDGQPIPGAVGEKYAPTTDDIGKTITVEATGTGNYRGTVTSAPTAAVTGIYTVTLPADQVGYTLTADQTVVNWNSTVVLTFTLHEGYSKTADFAILANGRPVVLTGERCALTITEDVTVTVRGVEDRAAPTARIEIAKDGWTSFLNTITFDRFFRQTQKVTITASDAGSGVAGIQYFVTDTPMTLEQVQSLAERSRTGWNPYGSPFNLDPDGKYIVYAKVTDNAGNALYLSSDGLILDATAPAITGVENGKTYYGDVVFQAGDAYLSSVAVDGKAVEAKDGKYTIPADNKVHVITAADKAGNVTAYSVAAMKIYTVTYKADGEVVSTQQVGHGQDATPPQVPEKSGYTGRWNKSGKCITADTIITARYTKTWFIGAPPTGDSSRIGLWTAVMLASGAGLAAAWMVSRKKKKTH